MMRRLLASSLLAVVALLGCHGAQKAKSQTSSASAYKVYKLRGKVISADPIKGEITLDSDAVPGFMEAMTMPYKVKDASTLGGLHPGDVVTADVLVSSAPSEDYLLDKIAVVAPAKLDRQP